MKWKEKYEEWQASPNVSLKLKNSMKNLDEQALHDSFYKYLEFGTGGMRGKVGAGINRMNHLMVRRLTMSLALYLKENAEPNKKGIVIQYDTRWYSKEFSEETAAVLASQGIPVFLSDQARPTPLLSYLVREMNAAGGVMITASHNPPEYNGYKIYNSVGGQLVPKEVEGIVTILNDLPSETELEPIDFLHYVKNKKITYYGEEMEQKYIDSLKESFPIITTEQEKKTDLKIVYTPLHGTGRSLLLKTLAQFDFHNVAVVAEQATFDGAFPTVKLPNPEEKEAFYLSIEEAKKKNADIIFATDPDADRLGVAIKSDEKDYQLITGNQLGAVLIHYLLINASDVSNKVIIKTIVTSDFGALIARSHNCIVKETLTGFKYIGELIEQMKEDATCQFLFGYEESYGYLIDPIVRDKDAIQAALLTAQAAHFYKKQGKTLMEVLEELYRKYGYFNDSLQTVTFYGKEERENIQRKINELRAKPPLQIAGEKIVRLEDYESGRWIDFLNNKSGLLTLPESDVMKFILEDGSWFAIRLSGTEEKCKIYFSAIGENDEKSKQLLSDMEKQILDNYF